MATNPDRTPRLAGVFRSILSGNREIRSTTDARLFFEAVRAQSSPSTCLESIVASKRGLDAIQLAVRADLSLEFVQLHTLQFLKYLSDEQIKVLAEGQLLRQVLIIVVTPPTLWKELIDFTLKGEFTESNLSILGWLFIELLCLPKDAPVDADVVGDVQRIMDSNTFSGPLSIELQHHEYKIRHLLEIRHMPGLAVPGAYSPGGRHDNDFADFREIAIYPTSHEFLSNVKPFYRTAQEVFETPTCDRARVHLDNLYRLLRENLMAELRDDWKGRRRGKRSALVLQRLTSLGFAPGNEYRGWKRFSLAVRCEEGLGALERRKDPQERRKFLNDARGYLKHQSFGALYSGQEIFAFGFIDRDLDALLEPRPVVILQFTDDKSFKRAIVALKTRSDVMFTVVGTPVFAYEPVLERLKSLTGLPLHDKLLNDEADLDDFTPEPAIQEFAMSLAATGDEEPIQTGFEISNQKLYLDKSQRESLVNALTKSVSIIQGPPGTGKSFIGALTTLYALKYTNIRILVISYTNHALDQFLEELMKLKISQDRMVRLGGKSTAQTASLLLSQQSYRHNSTAGHWALVSHIKEEIMDAAESLRDVYSSYLGSSPWFDELQDYLEFSDNSDDVEFYNAFQVPLVKEDGYKTVGRGKGNREIDPDYLFKRWLAGEGPGMFVQKKLQQNKRVWDLQLSDRRRLLDKWQHNIDEEKAEKIRQLAKNFKDTQDTLDSLLNEGKVETLRSKRIIGCTTTAAAKYTKLVSAAQPDMVIVEEAGEILESHNLTALTSSVKQLVLIGDHKQLRPKIDNYALTVEKGDGFDLNRSLFERLILQGRPHTTLQKQHRMHPEISVLVKELTYPELKDSSDVSERPMVRGFEDRVIFMNHSHPETETDAMVDRRDQDAMSSKENAFEGDMVLKLVKFLGQQGYRTKDMVVLTPYLGQLRLLRERLSEEVDPWLSDLDSFDLVRAGQITEAAASVGKSQLRLSTIDNYQGEESDIVVISLTRSNNRGDIGFLAAPERLNVLLSRAKNCVFMLGNMETFMRSKRGHHIWEPFFESLKNKGHLYDGIPVRCENHPDNKFLLKEPGDFDKYCPDGGCFEPCGASLGCGIHTCELRCHRISDHTKMDCHQLVEVFCSDQKHSSLVPCHRKTYKVQCEHPVEVLCGDGKHRHSVPCHKKGQTVNCKQLVEVYCPDKHEKNVECSKKNQSITCYRLVGVVCNRQHTSKVPCHAKNNSTCKQCVEEDKEVERRARRDLELEAERKAHQAEYKQQLDQINDEIEHQRRILKYRKDDEKQQNHLIQARDNLAALKQTAETASRSSKRSPQIQTQQTMLGTGLNSIGATPKPADDLPPSKAREEWEYLKTQEGAKSQPLDKLMDMIGLEEVKSAFLSIKSSVDTALRQDISLDKERFSCSILGNPGTGKTTVARLYAQFLTSVGVISGSCFKEETGSSLANAGVNGCKKIIDDILNDGGGVLFIDEAYQLTSGNSYGGAAVLDYLLPEVENLSGKIVFVLAGYHKQMESFFAHNPGLPSRFPIDIKFADYTDDELLRIFELKIHEKYGGRMRCEDGLRGLYCRIVARRVGRGRGREGFGNARAIENTLTTVCQRQAVRLRRERRERKRTDDLLLTREDLIGPQPAEALATSEAWQKLQALIGLKSVKEAVKSLVESVKQNYQRELDEQPSIEYSLNRVFLGSPGTGKTTVAKLYGSILVDLGLLSKGEVVLKKPSDFVGSALGQSEQQTKGILAASLGKVLVVDEAYVLYGGPSGDPYKTAVIDTIVAEVQSVPGDDRCVLLLGYKDQMEDMFQNVNPGLARRFALSSAFQFDDFNDEELRNILDLKLKQQGYTATDQAKRVATEILNRARNRPNFGNAGEVDIMLNDAKARHQTRLSRGETQSASAIEALDLDPNFDRAERSDTNVVKLFGGTVGMEATVSLLQGYQQTVKTLKSLEMDPKENIPFNFLFRGPPGTGKTTTAKKMGKVFYDMGFLATAEVVECSATDLIGQYVGQTGPKVQKMLDKALGRVLFVDEAYRLADGHFAKEAMDELVDSATKDKYAKKLIIVLAGYEKDINRLMGMNAGLTSRFPEVIDFRGLRPPECIELLRHELRIQQARLASPKAKKKVVLDISGLETLDAAFEASLTHLFEELSQQDNWASARDVKTVAKAIFNKTIEERDGIARGHLVVRQVIIEGELRQMLHERASRSKNATVTLPSMLQMPQRPPAIGGSTVTTATTTSRATKTKTLASPPTEDEVPRKRTRTRSQTKKQNEGDAIRDVGVSDEVWEQLKRDRQAEQEREQEYQDLLKAQKEAREADREKIIQKLLEEEERRKREAEARKKLEMLGVCPMGYQWIRQGGGYRCAGGSHFMSDVTLASF